MANDKTDLRIKITEKPRITVLQTTFQVIQGPSLKDLQDSLCVGRSDGQPTVDFKISRNSYPHGIRVRITALEREDGSGNCWLFKGYLITPAMHQAIFPSGKVHGFFNTQRRVGTMKDGHPQAVDS